MAMNLKEIESMIKEALPDAIIDIQDLAGDGNHILLPSLHQHLMVKAKLSNTK